MKGSISTDNFQTSKEACRLTMNLDSTFAKIKAENVENSISGLEDRELNSIYK